LTARPGNSTVSNTYLQYRLQCVDHEA
jgi:hypothetical protein